MEHVRQIGKVVKAYESVTVTNSEAVGLSAAKYGDCPCASITVEGAQVRFRVDDAPTTSEGHSIVEGGSLYLDSPEDIKRIKFIAATSTSATIRVSYSAWGGK